MNYRIRRSSTDGSRSMQNLGIYCGADDGDAFQPTARCERTSIRPCAGSMDSMCVQASASRISPYVACGPKGSDSNQNLVLDICDGTYQVQTNLSVQTMQTSIWTIGSTSKERDAGVGGGICKSVITQSKGGRLIVKLPNPPMPLGCGSGGPD